MHMDELLLERFSYFLNHHPDYVTAEMLRGFMADTGYGEETSYRFLICAAMDIDPYGSETERIWFHRTIPEILHPLDTKEYAADPYLTRIAFPDKKLGRWEFRHQAYRPYEAFVRDDFRLISLGHSVPQIGYFREAFPYPAVLQDGREWMTVTPNEINTMKNPIAQSHGRVLTFGLGMGYFAFHASEKEEVDELTIVERDPDVIRLFREHLLPQFPGRDKITLVQDDAFHYAQTRMGKENFDVIFTDLWHDPSDGIPLYQRMKEMEKYSPDSTFLYWIEKTLRYYL